jgi:hypothetical protein
MSKPPLRGNTRFIRPTCEYLLPGEDYFGDVLGIHPDKVEKARAQQAQHFALRRKCVANIAMWVYEDFKVAMDGEKLGTALDADFDRVGRYPTQEECDELVMAGSNGGDGDGCDGSVFESWTTFPCTSQYLAVCLDGEDDNNVEDNENDDGEDNDNNDNNNDDDDNDGEDDDDNEDNNN